MSELENVEHEVAVKIEPLAEKTEEDAKAVADRVRVELLQARGMAEADARRLVAELRHAWPLH